MGVDRFDTLALDQKVSMSFKTMGKTGSGRAF